MDSLLVLKGISEASKLGFPPGLFFFIAILIILVRNPKVVEWLIAPYTGKKSEKSHDGDFVDRERCHEAMGELKNYIHAENRDVREEMRSGFDRVHLRIDEVLSK